MKKLNICLAQFVTAQSIVGIFLFLMQMVSHAGMLECSDQNGHKFMVGEQNQPSSNEFKCHGVILPGMSRNRNLGIHNDQSVTSPIQSISASVDKRFMVTPNLQMKADNERKIILQNELESEQMRLRTVMGAGSKLGRSEQTNFEQDIHRIEQNISALNRELLRMQ
jgi:hypothetical protein